MLCGDINRKEIQKRADTHTHTHTHTHMTKKFQMYKLGIEKAETRDQIANICWIIEKGREFKNKSTFDSLTALKSLTLWITINCGKLLKRWEYQTTLPAFWETFMWDKKQQLELDMEKQT